jgi:hypothetical protein
VRVLDLGNLGSGAPDILAAPADRSKPMLLLEIKDSAKSPTQQRLTPDEAEFADLWNSRVRTVTTLEQALSVLGL